MYKRQFNDEETVICVLGECSRAQQQALTADGQHVPSVLTPPGYLFDPLSMAVVARICQEAGTSLAPTSNAAEFSCPLPDNFWPRNVCRRSADRQEHGPPRDLRDQALNVTLEEVGLTREVLDHTNWHTLDANTLRNIRLPEYLNLGPPPYTGT